MKNIFLKIFISLSITNSGVAFANQETKSTNLIAPSEIATLAGDREWLLLNHFWKNIFGMTVSRIDDPDFFFSKQRKNPQLELESFLNAVLEETISDDESIQCRYPARFHWVESKFELFKKNYIKKAKCGEFRTWEKSISLKRLVLVFPAAYLNNPASMFGHTLLRLDSDQGLENPLLSYAAGFSAATGSDGGVAFAVKGLLGGYRSSYSVEPYYETVKRYGDIEHRDIWEYELLLTPAEKERLMASLWELGHTYFDYYFFDENCSYYLLALLETVRPELKLLDEYGFWVIPSDTLKTVLDRGNILGEVKFRPSLTSKLEDQSSRLNKEDLQLALSIAAGETSPSSINADRERLPELLEFSFDYLEYQNEKSQSSEELAIDRNVAQAILVKRSKLRTSKLNEALILKPETRPDLTHDSGRFFSAVGRRGSQGFYDIELKPAYHDLLDNSAGFKNGAAIDILNFQMRHFESNRFQLQNFYPVAIESYSPWNRLFKPLSWNVQTGLERQLIRHKNKSNVAGNLVGVLRSNVGITLRPLELFSLSVLPGVRAGVSPSFDDSDYALGAGIGFKLFGALSEDLRYLFSGDLTRFGIGADHNNNYIQAELNHDLGKQFIFRTGVKREQSFSNYYTEYYFGIGRYF